MNSQPDQTSDNTYRTAKGERWKLYFAKLNDSDIQAIIDACEQELELRSQEEIRL